MLVHKHTAGSRGGCCKRQLVQRWLALLGWNVIAHDTGGRNSTLFCVEPDNGALESELAGFLSLRVGRLVAWRAGACLNNLRQSFLQTFGLRTGLQVYTH